MSRVLVLTDRGAFHQHALRRSAPHGLAIETLRSPVEAQLLAAIADAHFVISERSVPLSAAAIQAATSLRLIVRLGSLAYGIDLEAAEQAGIPVSLQPVETSINAAEHAVLMMLALSRRLRRAISDQAWGPSSVPARRTDEDHFAYNWLGYRDLGQLNGAIVGVIGMGEIGVELSRRLSGFRPRAILYNKRQRWPGELERALGIEWRSLDACVREADLLVSLLPYTPATAGRIGARVFSEMKRTALLIHAGSGGVIDELALIGALRDRRIAGAALDTFEYEPLPSDHSLRILSRDPAMNLLLTPHIASGVGDDDRAHDFDEIIRFKEGHPLRWRLTESSPERGTRR